MMSKSSELFDRAMSKSSELFDRATAEHDAGHELEGLRLVLLALDERWPEFRAASIDTDCFNDRMAIAGWDMVYRREDDDGGEQIAA